MRKTLLLFSFIFLAIFLSAHFPFASAQTADSVVSRRTQLESDLKTLEIEIDAQRKILEEKQKQSVSLVRDIAIYDARIKESDLSIRARNITINNLIRDISEKRKPSEPFQTRLTAKENLSANLSEKHANLMTVLLLNLYCPIKMSLSFFPTPIPLFR